MMAELVREGVCLRKVSGCAEAVPQLFKKPKVQVAFFILRTVERAGGGLGHPTARSSFVTEKNQLGMAIARARLGKQPVPGGLDIVQHKLDEFDFVLLTGVASAIGNMTFCWNGNASEEV